LIARTAAAGRFARASSVLALSAAYFAYVFRLPAGAPFKAGMADWIDPNFINFLLEHWYHSLAHLTSPVSPPMYFPARGTLGYSHGLVLFAPFYVAVRPFLHPFQAYNAAIFLVLNAGALSLYLVFRKFAGLGFVESLLLAAFFVTSPNIINEPSGIWSQRLSVFLIPQLALLALVAARRASLGLAWAAGLGFALLFTQDFYTAAFAALVAALFLAGALPLSGVGVARLESRPTWSGTDRKYLVALGLGALVGIAVFVKIYLRAYLEHPAFPEDQLNNALTNLDVSRFSVARALRTYESPRSFELVFVAAALAWVPWFRVDRRVRLCALWFAVVSLIVLAVPLRFRDSSGWDFSVWRTFIAPVPGFSSIRDPKRIIEFYELAATALAALFLAQLPRRAPFRILTVLIVFFLLATNWNRNVFTFARPTAIYDRWVEAPIAVDSSCEAFFIRGASDAYMSRSSNQWSLYAMDAMFISLRTGIPTLNGYSAWWPDGWRLSNPQNPGYAESVEQWIAQNGLRNVCGLDIEARTMTRR
jgi:hypothetical protein